MRVEGVVSVWVGVADSAERIEAYVVPAYTEDGDRVPPQVAEDFELRRFDDEFREFDVLDAPVGSLARLLDGFSYCERIIPRLAAAFGDRVAPPAGAALLLYNYRHDGAPAPVAPRDGVAFRFVGAVSYLK